MGWNGSLLKEIIPQSVTWAQFTNSEILIPYLLEEYGYDFGLFAILSTPKESLWVR